MPLIWALTIWKKKWFYLSSQIGYAKIGGTDEFNDPEPSTIQEIKNYLHFNTTIRAFQRKDALTWFAGIGPYYNLRIDGPSFTSADYKDFYKAKSYLGGRAEAGFHFDVSKIRFGLTGTYLYSFTHAAKTSAIGLKNNNLGFFASIGYKI
ncbi:MAG: hypothetical protein LRY55_03640 [Leadbetterella sp.]|nr:hypothetical protein [Leadbetterella sp.]